MNPEWEVRVIDVEGAFLQGKFQNGEEMYMEVPDGMEQYYASCKDVVLCMLVPIHTVPNKLQSASTRS
jgi:folate-dependent tRNA-U54 methylase TrmFO/GidA